MALLQDKTVLITGAGCGIGRACAELLGKKKANVIIADIDYESALSVHENMKKRGHSSFPVFVDVSIEKDVKSMISKSMRHFNIDHIDILINNAAIQTTSSFFELSDEAWRRTLDVNLTGIFLCSKEVARGMKKGGKIINMLSSHYKIPRLNKMHYDSAKAGAAMLTKEMALALYPYGITVNAISYGAAKTPMNIDWINDNEKVNMVLEKIPLKIIFQPTQIAKFTYEILLKFADSTTGSIFTVDGGRSLI
ncbi:MAG: SDR family oxidoreductase [Firmicutes bacterium]|nr:SDR family oxidoreductase [Bacillota bacterium]